MNAPLKQPVSIVLAGESQVGKNVQIVKTFFAKDAAGLFPFQPCLFLRAETSGAVTTSRVFNHPQCTVVTVSTADDVIAALEGEGSAFSKGHGADGQPFKMVAFDGWSMLAENTIADVRENVKADLKEDFMLHSAKATGKLRDALKAWNTACLDSGGALFLSTCLVEEHWRNRPGTKGRTDRVMVGWKMEMSDKPASRLKNQSNVIIYFNRDLPEIDEYFDEETESETGFDRLAAEWKAKEMGYRYYAVTRAVKFRGYDLAFVKFQDGLFKDLPPLWKTPDLGAALLESPLLNPQRK